MKKRKIKKRKKSFIRKITELFSKIKDSFYDDAEESYTKSSFNILEVLIIVIIAILFGIAIGYAISYKGNSNNRKLNEIIDTYNNILKNYYSDLDEEKLVDAAIKGMIDSLDDPYSNYMDTSTTEEFNETVDGSFVGIGVSVLFSDEYNKVVEVFEDSPAEKAGILVDDIILKVDDKDVKGIYGDVLTNLIRGKASTKVKLVIKRGNDEKTFTVKRSSIEIKNVSSEILNYNDKKIGYLNILTFAANTAKQFSDELNKLEKKKIDSLIIDIRDNPGGHLLQAKEILDLFFDKKTVLYQIASKNEKKKVYASSNEKRNYPVGVLINKKSASASEILAAAFQENYKNCIIVGETSYGKGTVQKSKNLSDGTSIKFTTQKWLTSKGVWINGKGINPDIEIKLSDEYYKDSVLEKDNQIQEILKRLGEMK